MNSENEWSPEEWKQIVDKVNQDGQFSPAFQALVKGIAPVSDFPLPHEACQRLLPAFVADERLGIDVGEKYVEVQVHLQACELCEAVYASLLDIQMDEWSEEASISAPPPAAAYTQWHRIAQPEKRDLLLQVARYFVREAWPEEQILFRAVSTTYFQNPKIAIQSPSTLALLLGLGMGGKVNVVTPYVLSLVDRVVLPTLTESVSGQSTPVTDIVNLVKRTLVFLNPVEPIYLSVFQRAILRRRLLQQGSALGHLSSADLVTLANLVSQSVIIEA